MSNGLAISGVTAVLQYYLHELYAEPGSPFTSTVNVSCLAPDLVQQSFQHNGPEPENQVNLFMHQVMHNPAWRNVDLPSLGADGKTRLTSPPLALDLHYLLTVYATDFWQAEALLGYALMMLHENPVLVRSDISNALQALSTPPEPYPGNPLTPVSRIVRARRPGRDDQDNARDSGPRRDGVVMDRAQSRLSADLSIPGVGRADAAAAADDERPAGAATQGSSPAQPREPLAHADRGQPA